MISGGGPPPSSRCGRRRRVDDVLGDGGRRTSSWSATGSRRRSSPTARAPRRAATWRRRRGSGRRRVPGRTGLRLVQRPAIRARRTGIGSRSAAPRPRGAGAGARGRPVGVRPPWSRSPVLVGGRRWTRGHLGAGCVHVHASHDSRQSDPSGPGCWLHLRETGAAGLTRTELRDLLGHRSTRSGVRRLASSRTARARVAVIQGDSGPLRSFSQTKARSGLPGRDR